MQQKKNVRCTSSGKKVPAPPKWESLSKESQEQMLEWADAVVYSDGSSSYEDKFGGWSAAVKFKGDKEAFVVCGAIFGCDIFEAEMHGMLAGIRMAVENLKLQNKNEPKILCLTDREDIAVCSLYDENNKPICDRKSRLDLWHLFDYWHKKAKLRVFASARNSTDTGIQADFLSFEMRVMIKDHLQALYGIKSNQPIKINIE